MENVLVPIAVFATVGWVAWVVFSSIRRYLEAKYRAETRAQLLQRVDSTQSLLALAETQAGKQLFESLAFQEERPTPYNRILNGVQAGIILCAFGGALLVLHATGVSQESEVLIFGDLAIGLGIGFGLAAAATYALSRSFGLLDRRLNP